MNKNISIGAFSQRQYKNVGAHKDLTNADSNGQNQDMCQVTVVYDKTMGQVSFENLIDGAISVKKGDTVKLTATPNSGYQFVKWVRYSKVPQIVLTSDARTLLSYSTSPTIDFVVNQDIAMGAVFAAEGNGGQVGSNGGNGANGGYEIGVEPHKNESALVSTVKKYWWVLAILLGIYLLKEDKA